MGKFELSTSNCEVLNDKPFDHGEFGKISSLALSKMIAIALKTLEYDPGKPLILARSFLIILPSHMDKFSFAKLCSYQALSEIQKVVFCTAS